MPFGRAAGPSRVYEYGCLDPIEGLEKIEEQLRLAHRYRNRLVEIERQRRTAYRELIASSGHANLEAAQAAVDEAQAEVDRILKAIAEQHRAEGTKRTSKELAEQLRDARAVLRERKAALREARRAVAQDPDMQMRIKQINDEANRALREARASCDVYWGTYLQMEAAAERARREKMDPKFKRWDGSGKLAVQLQGGLPVDALYGSDQRLRITEPLPVPGRKGRPLPRLYFRVGSNGREPVWAVLPVIIHRPLPAEARVKWAYLLRRRIGTHYRYRVQFVLEFPSEIQREVGPDSVALDVGWRRVESGLRVAYWVGSDGQSGEVVLPTRWLTGMDKVDELRSRRDTDLELAKQALLEWLDGAEVPDWLRDETETLHAWRSQARLAALVLRWRENRFAGDEEIYERLEAWRKEDKHHYEHEANLRDRLLGWRREIYRVLAARLRERYGTVYLKDFDLRLAARPMPGHEVELPAVRRARHLAGISQLRQALHDSGMTVVTVRAEHSTRACSWCGTVDEFDTARELRHTCSGCGREWDQDENAARNILLRGTGVNGAEVVVG